MDLLAKLSPVFIVGTPKSGTTLLWSLFDSHPAVLLFYESKAYRFRPQPVGRGALIHAIDLFMHALYADIHPLLERDRFLAQLERHLARAPEAIHRSILAALVDTVTDAMGADRSCHLTHMVDKTPAHFACIDAIARDFPRAKFIHVLRDPRDNYLALKRRMFDSESGVAGDGRYHPILFIKNRLLASLEAAYTNVRRFGDRYRILYYEDLISDPNHLVPELARWLGIRWDPALLAPTRHGTPWGGNSYAPDLKGQLRPFDRRPIGRWRRELSGREVRLLETILRSYHLQGKYPVTRTQRTWRLLPDLAAPFTGELRCETACVVGGSEPAPTKLGRVLRNYVARRVRMFRWIRQRLRITDDRLVRTPWEARRTADGPRKLPHDQEVSEIPPTHRA